MDPTRKSITKNQFRLQIKMPNIFPPSESTSNKAHVSSMDSYQKRYQDSISDPDKFWAEIAERLDWIEPWTTIRKFDFVKGEIEWFSGGKLNASYNCIDRHIKNGYGNENGNEY